MSSGTSPASRKKEIQQCALELQKLSRQPDNRFCVDCGERNPKWVSVTIGCWLCLNCSGLHRHLGANYSYIKSTTMDHWNFESLNNFSKLGGNKQTKIIYGTNMITNHMNEYKSLDFIKDKYVRKIFAKRYKSHKTIQKQPKKVHKPKFQKRVKSKQKHEQNGQKQKQQKIVPDLLKFEEKESENPKGPTADLLTFNELQNFHIASDLVENNSKKNNIDLLTSDTNITEKRKLNKAEILAKYKKNNNNVNNMSNDLMQFPLETEQLQNNNVVTIDNEEKDVISEMMDDLKQQELELKFKMLKIEEAEQNQLNKQKYVVLEEQKYLILDENVNENGNENVSDFNELDHINNLCNNDEMIVEPKEVVENHVENNGIQDNMTEQWSCSQCTFLNHIALRNCEMCDASR